jgi:hypothetical protein
MIRNRKFKATKCVIDPHPIQRNIFNWRNTKWKGISFKGDPGSGVSEGGWLGGSSTANSRHYLLFISQHTGPSPQHSFAFLHSIISSILLYAFWYNSPSAIYSIHLLKTNHKALITGWRTDWWSLCIRMFFVLFFNGSIIEQLDKAMNS